MPARRKSKKKVISSLRVKILKPLVGVLVLLLTLTIIYFFSSKSEWDGKGRIGFIVKSSESIIVTSLDPEKEEMISIKIPLETEVEVARNLGQWRIGSVWELGVNEGIGGLLLAETVTRYFHLPVYLYLESDDVNFLKGGLISAVKLMFCKNNSNLSKRDLFNIIKFSSSVKNPDKKTVDLSDSNYLIKVNLKGGGEGYKKVRDFDQSIIARFSNGDILERLFVVKIINNTGNKLLSTELGEVIEASGAKVAQVVNNEEREGYCLITSRNQEVGEYYSKLFSCEFNKVSDDSFDLVFIINKSFIERY